MIELQACPLCKKKIKQLHSHLRNMHRLSAKERRPYIKFARESAVKHKDTVLAEINTFNEFEEQKCSLDNDFKDIEDLIMTSYLKTKPSLTSTISIRETICSQLFPLYRMTSKILCPISGTDLKRKKIDRWNDLLLHSCLEIDRWTTIMIYY